MDAAQAIRTCLRKSFQFSGRASRSEYWWFMGFIALTVCIVAAIPMERNGKLILMAILFLPLALTSLSAGCRRFQDTGRSRWLFIGLYVTTSIIGVFSFDMTTVYYADVTTFQLIAFAASWAITLWSFSILIDNPTRGSNQYGPNPLEASK